jgi:hypothetical protein
MPDRVPCGRKLALEPRTRRLPAARLEGLVEQSERGLGTDVLFEVPAQVFRAMCGTGGGLTA